MRRALATAVLLVLVLTVALVSGALLLQRAGEHHDAATHAAMARAEAFAISQLEWRAIAEGEMNAGLRTELAQRARAFTGEVSAVHRAGTDPARSSALQDEAKEYVAAVAEQFTALAAGDLERAEAIDEDRVDPAFEEVQGLTGELAATAEEQSHAVLRTAAALCGLILVGTVLAVLLVLYREHRHRLRRQRAEADAAASARFAAMVRDAADATVLTDPDGAVLFATPALERLAGRPVRHWFDTDGVVEPEDADELRAQIAALTAQPADHAAAEFRLRSTDGTVRSIEARIFNGMADPAVRGLIWNLRDVTNRRQLEQRVAHQAFHDGVTGVANRALLTDRSDVAVARASRTGTTPAMVLLDLDGFKDVNDTMGHSAGDELLRAVAARLLLQVRPGDTVARFGGDEFAVLVEDCASPDDALDLAHRLLAATSEPVEIDERELRVTASVGVVVHTDQDGGELLRCADLAMYAAKRRGKNTVVLFEPAMRAMTEERVQLTAELRTAVADGQMAVAYQPVVDLQTEEVVGFEALARWIHPERGTIPPLTFIPLAEDSGAILELGRHVLALACAQVHEWSRRAGRRFVISVNVSGRQLADPGFTTDVRHVLALSGLPAEQLVLEITETTVIEDVAAARTRLAGLRRLGLRIAIDDFGTGYSSLSYLRNLPVDILKIDKSFVDDDTSQHGGELLAGVVALGSALALETLGEGIETSRQLQRLRAAGCQQGQGYHFARPLFPADVEQLLGDLHPSVPARP